MNLSGGQPDGLKKVFARRKKVLGASIPEDLFLLSSKGCPRSRADGNLFETKRRCLGWKKPFAAKLSLLFGADLGNFS